MTGKEITVLLPAGLHRRLKLSACQRGLPLKRMLAQVVRDFLTKPAKGVK